MPVDLKDLMRAARRMSDYEIKRDLEDCVAVLAGSEEDAEKIRNYGIRRQKGKYFSPGKNGHNNHEFISEVEVTKTIREEGLCSLSEQPSGRGSCRAECDQCGRSTYVRQNGTWARHSPPKR